MNMAFASSLLLGLLIAISILEGDFHCVSNEGGINDKNCTESYSHCCKSLKFLIDQLSELKKITDIELQILSFTKLDGVIDIIDFQNLTIIGENSTLECSTDESGVNIRNVSNLKLLNLTVKGCSMKQNSSTYTARTNKELKCAIYIINSINLTVTDVHITQNNGVGMVIYDTTGVVKILNSTFCGNKISNKSTIAGGGGLAIEFTLCKQQLGDCSLRNTVQNSTYVLENLTFENNYAYEPNSNDSSYTDRKGNNIASLGRGGGLRILLSGTTKMNSFTIHNCRFFKNSATTWGGGLYLSLRNNATENSIKITDSEFSHNKCITNGGGGLILALISYDEDEAISNTSIEIKNSNFTNNSAAKQGGGILIVSSRENKLIGRMGSRNSISFFKCLWAYNNAKLGSAVDISPSAWDVFGNGHLPTPNFINCIFKENKVNKDETNIHEGIQLITERAGVMLISRFAVELGGEVNFTDNNSNGVFLQSGTLIIQKDARISFINNTAKKGGGLALYAFSVMFISSNTTILFENNIATIEGGAIHVDSKDQHEKISSKSCFIERNYNDSGNYENTTITFKGNKAISGRGNALFVSSLLPCNKKCFIYQGSVPQDCPATIKDLDRKDITTNFDNFDYINETELNELFPGQIFTIPIKATDELKSTISIVFDTSLNNSSFIALPDNVASVSYVSRQKISLLNLGDKEESGLLLLANKEVTLKVNITLLECRPGYVIDESGQCNCNTSNFKGIWKCDGINNMASIINGYWIGPCDDGKQCSGNCPVGLCTSNSSITLSVRIAETYKLICNSNRRGKLCGNCTANHSVHYHSASYRCGDEKYCSVGIIFYILLEILPLTIIFIAIIIFNISFTTGAINGLILYSQIYDASIIDYYNVEIFPPSITKFFQISKFIYGTTNLNYFSVEKMSFCLWKGATTLDVIAWKYVTIVYALFLILATIVILNTLTCKRICSWWRPHTLKNAVIHGFTAFLVMSYSQSAKVSFQLLTYTTVSRYDFSEPTKVVLYGGVNFFSTVHVRYAVPAILFMITLGVLPPLLLFFYPLSFKILALCHLSELKLVNRISSVIPVQLFDSFQSCYKDNFRFFSGLYFFYRIVPLFLYAINTDLTLFYFTFEIFLIVALTLNSLLQPYKVRLHNQIDCLLFMNLAIINGISLYNYVTNNEGKDKLDRVKKIVQVTTSFQLTLIFLPLFCVIICCLWLAVKRLKKKKGEASHNRNENDREILLDSTYLPPLRDRNDSVASHDFQKMK